MDNSLSFFLPHEMKTVHLLAYGHHHLARRIGDLHLREDQGAYMNLWEWSIDASKGPNSRKTQGHIPLRVWGKCYSVGSCLVTTNLWWSFAWLRWSCADVKWLFLVALVVGRKIPIDEGEEEFSLNHLWRKIYNQGMEGMELIHLHLLELLEASIWGLEVRTRMSYYGGLI